MDSTAKKTAQTQSATSPVLPLVIAGPILRHCSPERFTLWLVTSQPVTCQLQIFKDNGQTVLVDEILQADETQRQLQLGQRAFMQMLTLTTPLPVDTLLHYELWLQVPDQDHWQPLSTTGHGLGIDGQPLPAFFIPSKTANILHGSCRKPHFPGPDALAQVDNIIQESGNNLDVRPSLLLMSGDQVYCDDVAGPMLDAIVQTIKLLGLFDERWEGAVVDNSNALYLHPCCFYLRDQLLPLCNDTPSPVQQLFQGARKPIFTTVSAHNHLVSAAEVLAMYWLVWSPTLWSYIDLDAEHVAAEFQNRYRSEQQAIEGFVKTLPAVQRALANVPVYMIFDDHDITDDWNLTRGWEESAYQHPFSRRILGNALLGYWLCQGWGNTPDAFPDNWYQTVAHYRPKWSQEEQDELIDELLHFDQWHYSLPTTPPIEVLDTRTHRWRSESTANKPSGLMDWESLSELQQRIIGQETVILVSPAPIFGVKLIEVIQRIFTLLGKPLTVDAENWMAHPGAANVLLNMFLHIKAPQNMIVLSGDVHYSFVYDVRIKRKKRLPQSNPSVKAQLDREIWQITASGIKNEFPPKLIRLFDRLDRFLYGSRSPLNWFTKRRRMAIKSRKPTDYTPYRLVNRSGIGQLRLNGIGEPDQVSLRHGNGAETVFPGKELSQRSLSVAPPHEKGKHPT